MQRRVLIKAIFYRHVINSFLSGCQLPQHVFAVGISGYYSDTNLRKASITGLRVSISAPRISFNACNLRICCSSNSAICTN
jgi:hypothetical protein